MKFHIAVISEVLRQLQLARAEKNTQAIERAKQALITVIAQWGSQSILHYSYDTEALDLSLELADPERRALINLMQTASTGVGEARGDEFIRDFQAGCSLLATLIEKSKTQVKTTQPLPDIDLGQLQSQIAAGRSTRYQTNSSTVLLDVDATAIISAAGKSDIYNTNLLDALQTMGVRDIYLFTNYFLHRAEETKKTACLRLRPRLALIVELLSRGFYVGGTVTPFDMVGDHKPGQYYVNNILPFEQFIMEGKDDLDTDEDYQAAISAESALKAASDAFFRAYDKGGLYTYFVDHFSAEKFQHGIWFFDDLQDNLTHVYEAHARRKFVWGLGAILVSPRITVAAYCKTLMAGPVQHSAGTAEEKDIPETKGIPIPEALLAGVCAEDANACVELATLLEKTEQVEANRRFFPTILSLMVMTTVFARDSVQCDQAIKQLQILSSEINNFQRGLLPFYENTEENPEHADFEKIRIAKQVAAATDRCITETETGDDFVAIYRLAIAFFVIGKYMTDAEVPKSAEHFQWICRLCVNVQELIAQIDKKEVSQAALCEAFTRDTNQLHQLCEGYLQAKIKTGFFDIPENQDTIGALGLPPLLLASETSDQPACAATSAP